MKGLNSINLINSMRVDRAEISTRGDVMLIGDNDAGKTAALRLWIYFEVCARDMLGLDARSNQDFADFYFPKPNSYIIYELFNDEHLSMIILSCRNKVVCARFVDLPYKREYFFDDEDRAFVRWEDIADKIGSKANDFAEVRGEENLRKIIYGNYNGPKATDYRRFSLVRTKNADGLRRAVQGVFLNRDLVETRTIRDFILRSLNLYDAKVSITSLKNLILPVKKQYDDILIWNEVSEDGAQVKLGEAKSIIERYERKQDKDDSIAMAMGKLNYIPIRNKKLIDAISEVVKERAKERDMLEKQISDKEKEYPSLLEKYMKPVHDYQNQLISLENSFKYYQDKDRKLIITIFNSEDVILQTLTKDIEEYNSLTSATGTIEERYAKMLDSVLSPLYLMKEKWTSQIKEKSDRKEKEKMQITVDYQTECKNIQEHHSEIVTQIMSTINQKNNEIVTLNGKLVEIANENMFSERRNQITSESRKCERNIGKLNDEISTLKQNVNKIKADCEKDVSSLKVRKDTEWKQEEKQLTDRQKSIYSRLEGIDGSFLKYLENNKPGWEDNIGKVVSEEMLFSHNLSPIISEGNSFYGVEIDLSKTRVFPVTIDNLQKELTEVEKELRKVRMFIDNPDIALQTDIQRIEEGYAKKVSVINRDLKSKEDILKEEENHLQDMKEELDSLAKRERIAKDTKSRQIQEKIGSLTNERDLLSEELNKENSEEGYLKLLSEAKTSMEIRISALEHYATEISNLEKQIAGNESEIRSEKERIENMKAKELADNNIDATRINTLRKEIEEYTTKKAVLDKRENIILYGNYKKFLDEYTKKETIKNKLSIAEGQKNAFIAGHRQEMEKLTQALTCLKNEIQRETGRQSSLSEEQKLAWNNLYGDERDFDCPSYLETSEIIEHEEKALDLIASIKKLLENRAKDLEALHTEIEAFVKPFSFDNVYKFKKLFNFNDKNYTEYCDFAQWLKDFVRNETWKEDERVSYIHFNDIIKEAGHEYRETEANRDRVEGIITKINRDLRNLSFSKINYIEFKTRDSGNTIFKVLKDISSFYKDNSDAIENDKMGIFAMEIPEAELDVLRQKAMDLIFKLSLELSSNTISEICLKDTFEMDVTGQENGNTIPWTMSFTNFGSKGTSFVARTLINIVLIDVFKNNLESPQDFAIHCVMDEIGQLDTNNRKGILSFARARNIYLVQAAPETMDGSDYNFVYYIETQNGKCKITKLIDE